MPNVEKQKKKGFKKLIEYWSINGVQGLHPSDEKDLKGLNIKTANDKDNPYYLHLDLFPEPYYGNLTGAKIVFLYLNPGYHTRDDDIVNCERMKKEFKNNLNQSFSNKSYPFFWLNPDFKNQNKEENPGAHYWNRLFDQKSGSFLTKLAKDCFDGDSEKARKWLANNVCDIELFPYHSVKFKRSWTNSNSAEEARNAVFKEIEVAIEYQKMVLFILMRSKKLWINGCKEREKTLEQGKAKGIVVINKSVQNPSLNPELKDDHSLGKEIMKFINRLKESKEL